VTGEHVYVQAYAKLNLALDVRGKLPDGYHEMCMVMQTAGLCDDLELWLREDGVIQVKTDLRYLPNDDRNIAAKAARVFFQAIGREDLGAGIVIKKRIPVCAGLGGGSADGAAVLRALNEMTGAGFSRTQLEALGLQLGADVPFCVAGGTALARGRGEILEDLPPLPDCTFVICKPRLSISTPELFGRIDGKKSRCHPDTAGMVTAIRSGRLKDVVHRMYNVFEDVLPRQYGEIGRIKDQLLDTGAMGVVMTGTGSAVFGVFEDPDLAARAQSDLCARYRDCFAVQPVQKLNV
jgi:4-diphosphocytidyl-2-C-methyl-D-erythritol kinase